MYLLFIHHRFNRGGGGCFCLFGDETSLPPLTDFMQNIYRYYVSTILVIIIKIQISTNIVVILP